jgi:asparagine synthase (glutamine-hydrolysing)
MCGIFAVINGPPPTNNTILKHRGPDNYGRWTNNNTNRCVTVDHYRLAIVDPRSGKQPFIYKEENTTTFNTYNDIVLSVNGEIYNCNDIRDLTPGYRYQTMSDCEPILGLYLKYLQDDHTIFMDLLGRIPNSLDGKFAFIIHDDKNNITMFAKDPFGVLPLYIGVSNDFSDLNSTYIISSEMKAIYNYCPKATVTDVPPGYFGVIHSHGFIMNRYNFTLQNALNNNIWDYTNAFGQLAVSNAFMEQDIINFNASAIRVRELLINSVRKRLMSDVPFGVLLSGGLDSSIIAAITAKWCLPKRIHTFSVGLENSSDILAAREVATHINSIHHECIITEKDVVNTIRDAVYYLETYDVASIRSGIPMMLLSRYINKLKTGDFINIKNGEHSRFKMVLNGDGSDEIFAGYAYFKYAPNHKELQLETVRKVSTLYKYDCLRANKSMMCEGGSIECRCPYLDKELVKYVLCDVNPKYKMFNYPDKPIEKYLLRKAFDCDNYLPHNILWRSKIQFSVGCGSRLIDCLIEYANKGNFKQKYESNNKNYINPPLTNEAAMYRNIFDGYFPPGAASLVSYYPSMNCSTAEALLWLPEELRKKADPCGLNINPN